MVRRRFNGEPKIDSNRPVYEPGQPAGLFATHVAEAGIFMPG